jgi:hypothetical protein
MIRRWLASGQVPVTKTIMIISVIIISTIIMRFYDGETERTFMEQLKNAYPGVHFDAYKAA